MTKKLDHPGKILANWLWQMIRRRQMSQNYLDRNGKTASPWESYCSIILC